MTVVMTIGRTESRPLLILRTKDGVYDVRRHLNATGFAKANTDINV